MLGYDLSRTGTMLVIDPWRQRLLAMLAAAGVSVPVYWSGPAGVQVVEYGDRVALVNYNANPVTGFLNSGTDPHRDMTVPARDVRFVSSQS